MNSDEKLKNTAKTIADIKIHIKDEFSKQAQFLEDYNHCVLCGTELEFTHIAHFIHQTVEETATCPSCDIQTRQKQHSLQ
ncbi:MAG: hypothetical protein KDD50_10640 [Bdellovibrionales bacterium]|nr:hypothetical protein [Bdellovibrionales bacterium]